MVFDGNFAFWNFFAIASLSFVVIANSWRAFDFTNTSNTSLQITKVWGVRISTFSNTSSRLVWARRVFRKAMPLAFPPREPEPSLIKALRESN